LSLVVKRKLQRKEFPNSISIISGCYVISLLIRKRPVLWADIALKHPEALALLPKETIFIDGIMAGI